MKNIIKYLFVIFLILFLVSIVAIEVLHYDGPTNHLLSREYTETVVKRLARLSIIYQFLLLFMFFLLAYAFVSVFKLLISPLVAGKIYKISIAVVLYLLCLVVCIRGYSVIINADHEMNLIGQITLHAYQTNWPHVLLLALIFSAKRIEKSIRNDLKKLYEDVKNTDNRYNNYDDYKEIINEHSKKKY